MTLALSPAAIADLERQLDRAKDDLNRLLDYSAIGLYAERHDDPDLLNCAHRSLPDHLQAEIEARCTAEEEERLRDG